VCLCASCAAITYRRQATDWIANLRAPDLVCEIVRRVSAGLDLRELSLTTFRESLQEDDFFTLTDNLRMVRVCTSKHKHGRHMARDVSAGQWRPCRRVMWRGVVSCGVVCVVS
jgi:hypothetical protein